MRLRLYRRRIVITKKSDNRSIIGVLWSKWFGIWTLKDARVENGKGELVPADGEVLVMRSNIDYIQRLP